MQQPFGFWRGYGVPVLIALGLLGGLNALFNLPALNDYIKDYYFLYTAVVVLAGGSIPALLLLWRSSAGGVVTRDDLGLAASGWTAPRRLGALAVIAAYAGVGFAVLPHPGPPAPAPTWSDLCFWFAFLLSSSLAEMLVFVGLAFCLLERGLCGLGMGRLRSATVAALFASVMFGLYHYTHPPRFHALVFPLMGEMLLVLLFLRLTGNFYLTFILHNLTAAVGFTSDQASVDPTEMAALLKPVALLTNLSSFVIPFVLLHLLEWKGWPGERKRRPPDPAWQKLRPAEPRP